MMRTHRLGLAATAAVVALTLPALGDDTRDLIREFEKLVKGDDVAAFEDTCKALVKTGERKAIKVLLEDGLKPLDPDRRVPVERALATLTDGSSIREVANELRTAKELHRKVSLLRVLGKLNDSNASRAIGNALREREDALREAAARAAGESPLGKEHDGKLERLLSDDSLRVRKAAADALGKLGKAQAGYDVDWMSDGLPSKVFASHLAILYDSTKPMYDARFKALEEAKADDKGKPIAPKPSAPIASLRKSLDRLLGVLPKEAEMKLVAYALNPREMDDKYVDADEKAVAAARDWIKEDRFTSFEERDVYRAVRAVMDEELDEIYLVLGGRPRGGVVEDDREVADRIAELAAERGVRIHTVTYILAPEAEPSSREGQAKLELEQSAIKDFGALIASKCGGHASVVTLSAFETKKAEGGDATASSGSSDGPSGEASKGYTPPTPDKGRLSSAQVSQVRKDLKRALDAPSANSSREVVEKVAGLPDDKVAEMLLDEVVFHRDLRLSEAAIAGFSGNASDEVVKEICKELKGERDGGKQVLLVRCLSGGSKALAEELAPLIPKLERDAQRLALEVLARRPRDELDKAGRELERKLGKKATGLIAAWIETIVKGAAPPNTAISSQGFLPEKVLADGAAFLVDVHKEALEVLWRPEAPKEGEAKKKDAKAPQPETRLDAMNRELTRALVAMGKEGRRALVVELGESPASSFGKLETYDAKAAEKAAGWTARTAPTATRDIVAAVKTALREPEVEEVFLLACGLADRAEIRDVEGICEALDEINRTRKVRIHTIVVTGLADEADLSVTEKAARKDRLDALEALYKTIADRNGGVYQARSSRPAVAAKAGG